MDNNDFCATSGSKDFPCFFCLRDSRRHFYSSVCKSDSNERLHVHEFSLRNIYRFLDSLRSDEQDKVLNELKMRICEQCSKLVKEFNDLFNLLEETKLRLNWCIQKMEQIMSKSSSKAETESEETRKENGKLMKMLRTDTLSRIKAVTATSLPRVLLNKAKRVRQTSTVAVDRCKGTSSKFLKQEYNASETSSQSETEVAMAANTTLPEPEELMPPSQSQSPTSVLSVDHHHFEEDINDRNGFQDYLRNPCDMETECDVQRKLRRNVKNATDEENVSQGNGIKKKGYRASSNNSTVKKAPGYLSNFTPLLGLFPSSNKKVRCKSCKKTVERSKALAHWRSFHIAKNFEPVKCSYCPFLFRRKGYILRHLVRFHPEHFFQEKREKASRLLLELEQFQEIISQVFSEFSSKNEGRVACSLCKVKYDGKNKSLNRILLQRHLISRHKAVLNERLEQEITLLQTSIHWNKDKNVDDSGGSGSGGKNTKAAQRTTSQKKPERIQRNGIPKQQNPKNFLSKCLYCHFNCSGDERRMSNTMRTHQVRFHPEQYFPEEREKTAGLLDLKQFQSILEEFLFPEFILRTDGSTLCSLCPLKYEGKSHFRVLMTRHLITRHRTELREKLKVILEERLSNLNSAKEAPATAITEEPQQLVVSVCPVPEYVFNCPYCPFTCATAQGDDKIRTSVINHLVSYHPEHFLLSQVPEEWRHEPIGKILTDIVLPKFVLTSGTDTSCSFCEMKCSESDHLGNNIVMAKKHVLLMHQAELKEVVRIVLENPELMKEGKEKVGESKTKINPGETSVITVSGGETSLDQDESSKTLNGLAKRLYDSSKRQHDSLTRQDDLSKQRDDTEPMTEMKEKVGESKPISETISDVKKSQDFMSNFCPVFSDNEKVHCKFCSRLLNRKNAFMHWKYFCLKGLRRPMISKKRLKHSSKVMRQDNLSKVEGDSSKEQYDSMKRQDNSSKGLDVSLKVQYYLSQKQDGTSRRTDDSSKEQDNSSREQDDSSRSQADSSKRQDGSSKGQDNASKVPDQLSTRPPLSSKGSCRSPKRQAQPWKCPNCPVSCSGDAYHIGRHLVRFHPEHYFREEKEKVLGSGLGLALEQFQKILRDNLFAEYISKYAGFTSCSLCGKMFRLKNKSDCCSYAQMHVIYNHKMDLKGRLKVILQDLLSKEEVIRIPSTSSTATTMTMTESASPLKEPTQFQANNSASNCPYCYFKCTAFRNSSRKHILCAHLIRYHPEHFLSGDNDEGEILRPEDSRRILIEVVFPKFILMSGRHSSCSLCGMKYDQNNCLSNNVVLAKKHVLFVHKNQVREELRTVIQGPLLWEKLKSNPIQNEVSEFHSHQVVDEIERVNENEKVSEKDIPAYMSNFILLSCTKNEKVICKLCMKTLNRSGAFEHWKYHYDNDNGPLQPVFGSPLLRDALSVP